MPATFSFAPPDSTEVHGAVKSERIRFTDSVQGPIDSTSETLFRLFLVTPTGYEMIQQPLSIISRRNGQETKNPILGILADTEIKYELDSNGYARQVSGYEEVQNKADKMLPQYADALRKSMNPTLMAEEDRARWNAQVALLSGKQVIPGEVAYGTVTEPLPDGSKLNVYIVCKVTDTSRIGGKLVAHIDHTSDSDFERLAKSLGRSTDKLAEAMNLPDSVLVGDDEDQGSNTRMSMQMEMEVGTMLIREQHSHAETTIRVVGPDSRMHNIRQVKSEDIDFTWKQMTKSSE
ncbi:MAG: hypothetical protein PVH24_04870 [Candidatus Zixiibacteriota bacterium]